MLAVSRDDDYPYAVLLSYVYRDNKIFLHHVKAGHKLDVITKNTKVSFRVIDQGQVMPDEYTSCFRSAIVFGKTYILEEETEKGDAIDMLAGRRTPNHERSRRLQATEKKFHILCVIEPTTEHISDKEAIELVKAKCIQDS